MCEMRLYIPKNDAAIIPEGYYTLDELSRYLRDNKRNPEFIQFIADMMES